MLGNLENGSHLTALKSPYFMRNRNYEASEYSSTTEGNWANILLHIIGPTHPPVTFRGLAVSSKNFSIC